MSNHASRTKARSTITIEHRRNGDIVLTADVCGTVYSQTYRNMSESEARSDFREFLNTRTK